MKGFEQQDQGPWERTLPGVRARAPGPSSGRAMLGPWLVCSVVRAPAVH